MILNRRMVLTLTFSVSCFALANAQDAAPSNPERAIAIGDIDRVATWDGSNFRFRCVGYDINIDDRAWWKNTQYFKFSLDAAGSEFTFQVRETPDSSLWFILRNSDLSEIKTYKGGDDQTFTRDDLAPGTYYVQLVTDSTVGKLPDGTNQGFVVAYGYPKGISKVLAGRDEPKTIALGTLSGGTPITKSGFLYILRTRKRDFVAAPNNHDCPDDAETFDLPVREYTMQAPAGEIYVALTVTSNQNWAKEHKYFNVQRWVGHPNQWANVDGSPIKHSGGEFKIRIGDVPENFRATSKDAYVGFDLVIGLNPTVVPAPSAGGTLPSINLDSGFKPGKVIIGPPR